VVLDGHNEGRPRLVPALTGVRALGALWVLGFHASELVLTVVPELQVLRPVLARGYLGVDLFFALSGWVLAHSYAERIAGGHGPSFARFAWQRLARIYPVHAVILAVLVAGWLSAGALGFTRYAASPLWALHELPAQVALVHAWGAGHAAWNVPSWSLSCEWLGYLLFPALARLVMRLDAPRAGAAALALIALGLAGLRWLHGASLDLTYTGGVSRFAIEFTAGALIWRWQRDRGALFPWDRSAAILLAGIVPGAVVAGIDTLSAAALVLCVPCVAGSSGAVARLLGSRAFVHAGQASFALYMVHEPALLVLESLWPVGRDAGAALPLRLAHAVAVILGPWLLAEVGHRAIEEPARRFLLALPERRAARSGRPAGQLP
jgi:peptidoglycan/LPS O-acetylase OafA/YrhL